MATESLQRRAERIAQTTWLGGPPGQFEQIGRLSFDVLVREGLQPSSRVLDVGCGALRLGYWLMRYLDPGCYYGIEPQQEMLQVGLDQVVEPETVERANAHFQHNDDFDFSVFGETFNYVVARSIWTHTSRSQISRMLSSFAANGSENAVLLTSYKPASMAALVGRAWSPAERAASQLSLAARLPRVAHHAPAIAPRLVRTLTTVSPKLLRRWPEIGAYFDYRGESWVGRSDTSNQPGVVWHRFGWIADEAARNKLKVRQLPYGLINHQFWLRIEHM